MTIIEASTENHMDIIESLAREIWTEHYIPIIGEQQVGYMLARYQSKQAVKEQIASGVLYFLIEEGQHSSDTSLFSQEGMSCS